MFEVLASIYNDQSIKAATRLRLIKETQIIYPEIDISKEYLEVYIRFESYHSKYDIAIPMGEMFPVELLWTSDKDVRRLFDQVASKIVLLVD